MRNGGMGSASLNAGTGLPVPPCVLALPPRGDAETVVEGSWALALSDGVNFEGLRFSFPEGCSVSATARWLEPSLLSVSLSLGAAVNVPCSRCLKQASLAISDVLVYLYYPRGLELGRDTDLESDDGLMPVEVDAFGRTLDLALQVWESLLLLLPFKPLCAEDCLGLCPRCGADLNEGPCSCKDDAGDPRFEALRLFSEGTAGVEEAPQLP